MPGSGGEFELTINGKLAYSKKQTGQYPELGTLKQAVVEALAARART